MAIIGTLIVTFINYLRDMPFNSLYTTISFFLFWIFGIFMAKRKPNNKNKNKHTNKKKKTHTNKHNKTHKTKHTNSNQKPTQQNTQNPKQT